MEPIRGWVKASGVRNCLAGASILLVLLWTVPSVRGGGTVSVPTEAALRAALVGGGMVNIACSGTIYLSNTITLNADTTIDAGTNRVTISGGNAVRIFTVNQGVTSTLRHLTLADGFYQQQGVCFACFALGGAICSTGRLWVLDCLLTNNMAKGTNNYGDTGATEGDGGAIYNIGSLALSNCVLAGNWAVGGITPIRPALANGSGFGGGLYNLGDATVVVSTFSNNRALGIQGPSGVSVFYPNAGGAGGQAAGAGIWNGGTLLVSNTTFWGNMATAGGGGDGSNEMGADGLPGGNGGAAEGSGIYSTGTLVAVGVTIAGNSAAGGAGGAGGPGSAGQCLYPSTKGGSAGAGGAAKGAGICAAGGTVSVVGSTLSGNLGSGGAGGVGGHGGDGGGCGGRPPGADGGPGGAGGGGSGAIYVGAGVSLRLTNVTVAGNGATGGVGGLGGTGGAYGSDPSPPYIGHGGAPGTNGLPGLALGNLANDGLISLKNTIVAHSLSGTSASGLITDLGNNLSSDASCQFTAPTSRNNVDPKLGPLADNGGPTQTMALLDGSPAIDAGDAGASPPLDQRGRARPWPPNAQPDVGAYERGAPPPNSIYLFSPVVMSGQRQVPVYGPAGLSVRLEASSNLSSWASIATNTLSQAGLGMLPDTLAPSACRFYRARSP